MRLDGESNNSAINEVSFLEPNGTFLYALGVVPGWTTPSYVGSVSVNGAAASRTFVWVRSAYAVTFTEVGLPAHSNWSVLVNGTSHASTSSAILVNQPNGSYAFQVDAVPGFMATPWRGTVTVNGAAQTRAISFDVVPSNYTVAFVETGLPNGLVWAVSLIPSTKQSSTNEIAFPMVSNGAHAFTVGPLAGYNVSPLYGTITVAGGNYTKAITFSVVASPEARSDGTSPIAFLGLPAMEGYAVLGGLVAAAVVVAAVALRMGRRRKASLDSAQAPAEPNLGDDPGRP